MMQSSNHRPWTTVAPQVAGTSSDYLRASRRATLERRGCDKIVGEDHPVQRQLIPWTTWLKAAGFGLAAAGITMIFIGVPTVLIPNPWFSRMTPVRPIDWVFLGTATLLAGLLGASYAFPAACPLQEGKLSLGGLLTFFAVGCPVCNKLVVLALGVSGALQFFAPLQPILGLLGLLLLLVALWSRWRAIAQAVHAPALQLKRPAGPRGSQ